jgi:acyl-CoA synthetase (AMP-forming)/AMP-acid ligase II
MDTDQARTLIGEIVRMDEHPALIAPGTGDAVSYAELHEAVERIARQLCTAGLAPGDAVGLSLTNGPAFVLAFLGVIAAGGAAAPLNPAYTEAELRGYLADLRPRLVVRDTATGGAAEAVPRELGLPVHVLDGGAARSAALVGVAPEQGHAGGVPDGVALLLHTSGTTSRPKCVPLRQRNLARSARTVAATYGLGAEDVSHCVMPLFHVHGLVASTLATLVSGGTVLVPSRFSASTFWAESARHGASWYSAVPTIHQVLLARARAGERPEHVLRFARSCSSALPEPVWQEFESSFGIPLVEAYGMTEASHQMASNPLPPGDRRPRTVGVATGIELSVLDDDWRPLPPRGIGEVAVRGASIVDGYRDNPEANASSFRHGWFRTGDRGRLSEDGYLTLDGRLKELINRGGEKISPHEVEDALLSHPDVVEAVAFGAPDPKYGERVGAAVVVRGDAGQRELSAHCAERLASFKVPAFIAQVHEIPKGPTGKIQRRLMAELLGR